MRELKFRAYDKEHKKMRAVNEMSFSPEGYIHGLLSGNGKDQLGRVYLGEPVTVDADNPNHPGGWIDDYPLMQYLGRGKDDVELYESDIVVYDGDIKDPDCYYEIKWDDGMHGFTLGDDIPISDMEHLVVLGNIYQNPELLS